MEVGCGAYSPSGNYLSNGAEIVRNEYIETNIPVAVARRTQEGNEGGRCCLSHSLVGLCGIGRIATGAVLLAGRWREPTGSFVVQFVGCWADSVQERAGDGLYPLSEPLSAFSLQTVEFFSLLVLLPEGPAVHS